MSEKKKPELNLRYYNKEIDDDCLIYYTRRR